MEYILAADIGGTKLAVALFRADGVMVSSAVKKSETKDGELLYRLFTDACDELYTKAGVERTDIKGISIGLPGIVDVDKGVAVFQNNLPWRDFPIKERLSGIFTEADIKVDNDVYMATWGEYKQRGYAEESLVYVTLSTGISCCSIMGGQFVRGAGMAGEIGFSIVDDRMARLEMQVSGPAMEAKGKTAFANPDMTLHDIMDRYYANDDQAVIILNEAVRALAREVHHTLLLLDPHTIVLGGGVFNNHPRLVEAVKKELTDYLQHPLFKGKEQRIEASLLKGDAGLWGAFFRFGAHKKDSAEESNPIYCLTNEV